MGSLKRKIERKKRLRKTKESKKNLKKVLNATMGMPTKCVSCGTDFDPIEDADTWMVSVFDEVVQLNCPKCYKKALSQG